MFTILDAIYERLEGTLSTFHDRIFALEQLSGRNEGNLEKAKIGIEVTNSYLVQSRLRTNFF